MSGRYGPILTGLPGVTTSGTVPRSSRWRPRLSAPSPRPSRPSNNARTPAVKLSGRLMTRPDRAMIESHDLGGTCPNRGCTPKKVLVAAGHALHEIERAAVHHISVGKPKLDWAALIDREKDLIKDIPANLARSMT